MKKEAEKKVHGSTYSQNLLVFNIWSTKFQINFMIQTDALKGMSLIFNKVLRARFGALLDKTLHIHSTVSLCSGGLTLK